ncbi:yod1 deubiquitinase isoform X2 [Rhodnius prolixus]|uniref:yod1 deubiquitinase isoform X2 n=1 Tax=Rhodnius prolixus TaxID=13249 RepID=UPI003D18A54F
MMQSNFPMMDEYLKCIKTGDTIIIQETKNTFPAPNYEQKLAKHHTDQQSIDSGILMRQIVPADNSCLFTSIGFVLGGKVDATCGTNMRQIIADELVNQEDAYCEAILGRPIAEYREWIKKPDSWGGAVELAVLSKYYGIEIAVVDTANSVINRFGEDQNYDYRMFLIYDGIHYDPLYRESLQADGQIQTLFLKSNEKVLFEAEELAKEAKSSKQFTDVNRFSLRCLVCRKELTGQSEAQEHAVSTGHTNFGEIAS